jgi:hypothetical protein
MIFPRGIAGRVAVYVTALVVVVWLMRVWQGRQPAGRMTVLEVRQAERWQDLTARPGEKLLIVGVRMRLNGQNPDRWEPALFRLEDEDGRRYRPVGDSPLLQNSPYEEPAGSVEGLLLFRVPATATGRSLSFLPEGREHADSADHQSEDTGP